MTEGEQLGDMDHTNPYTDEPFGDTETYGRGRRIAADGGEADAAAPEAVEDGASDDAETVSTDGGAVDTLGDVDHTPPGNAPSANGAYDRTDGNDV